MQNFEYWTPTRIIFGQGVVDKLPETMKRFGKKVLLAYGGGSIKKNGLYDKVKSLLADWEIYELPGVAPNPKFNPSVVDGVKICKEKGVDVILAVGGGSVLDCAKAIAGAAGYDGDPWDVVTGKVPTTSAIPIVDIITMAATGSEYDAFSVISRTETNDKVAYYSELVFPAVSFIDPTYTYSVPKNQMLAGVADAINHVMEQYFNEDPNDLADGMMEASIKSLIKNLEIALVNPEDYNARAEIFLNCTLACNRIFMVGEAQSGWPMHAIEHALSAYYDITHGVGLAIITPRWMKHILSDKTEARIANFGVKIFGLDPATPVRELAEQTIDATYKLFEKWGIPMCLKDVGIDESRLGEMAKHVADTAGLDQPFVYAPLKEEDILEIYKASL